MFKYDEVISTLTLVNTLAKDVDYGNVKQETTKNKDCESNEFYNLQVINLHDKEIIESCNLNFAKFIVVCKNIFYELEKDLVIFLQKLVLYCEQLKLKYG